MMRKARGSRPLLVRRGLQNCWEAQRGRGWVEPLERGASAGNHLAVEKWGAEGGVVNHKRGLVC